MLERSTRHLRLTEAGAGLLEYANQGVEAFEAGLSTLDHYQQSVSGKLRLSLPPGFIPWQADLKWPPITLSSFLCIF